MDIQPYILSKQEKPEIEKVVKEMIAQLPQLKDRTEISLNKGFIYLHMKNEQGEDVRWARITVFDKVCSDCMLMLFKKSWKPYTKGSLWECLKSAEAARVVL